MSHLDIKQSSVVAAFITVVGQVVSLVPAWAPDKSHILSAGTFAIAGVFWIANAVHHLADSKAPQREEILQDTLDVVRGEVGKVNFNALVHDAVEAKSIPDLEGMVRTQVQRIFADVFGSTSTQPVLAAVPSAQPDPAAPHVPPVPPTFS